MASRTGTGLLLFQIARFSGANTRVSKFLIADDQCQDILNFTFTDRGALKKLPGFSKWNASSLGASKMLGGERFYKDQTDPRFVEAHNGKIYAGNDGGQTFLELGSGFSTTAKWRMKINRNLLFMLNGIVGRKWNGNAYLTTAAINTAGTGYTVNDVLTFVSGTFTTAAQVRVSTVGGGGEVTAVAIVTIGDYTALPTNPVSVTGGTGSGATFNLTFSYLTLIGIVAPTAAPTAAVNGAGNLTGTYKWKYTYVTSTHESNGSPVSNTLSGLASNKVDLTGVAVSSNTAVTKRRIYRTAAGGSDFFYVGEIANNVDTTFTDNVADSSLGSAIPTLKDPPTTGNRFIEAFKNRLWIAGETVNPRRLYFSEYFEPEAWPSSYYVDVPMTPGDEITGLKVLGDILVIYGHNTPYLVIGETSFDFTVKRSFAQTGTESDRTIAIVENSHIYLSRFGVYAFDGAVSKLLSDDIDPTIRNIDPVYIVDAAAGYHDKNKLYRLAVTNKSVGPAEIANNREYCYDLRNNAWFFTDRTIEYYHHLDGPGDLGELFTASPTIGHLFQEDSGETADGADMTLKWASKAYILGIMDFPKQLRHILFWSSPNEYPLTLSVEIDDDAAKSQTFEIPASSALPIYGSGIYGTSVYGGPGIVRVANVFAQNMTGNYAEVGIETTQADKSLTIHVIEFSYRVNPHLRIR